MSFFKELCHIQNITMTTWNVYMANKSVNVFSTLHIYFFEHDKNAWQKCI